MLDTVSKADTLLFSMLDKSKDKPLTEIEQAILNLANATTFPELNSLVNACKRLIDGKTEENGARSS